MLDAALLDTLTVVRLGVTLKFDSCRSSAASPSKTETWRPPCTLC